MLGRKNVTGWSAAVPDARFEGDKEKAAAATVIQRSRDALLTLSHEIHSHPELKWEEERASAWVAGALADAGFSVTPSLCGLPTAFEARWGSGPLHVALCAEYDALPGVGHACGHNIIAATAVGAGKALARLADDLGITVRVIGTPAEEGGGGKTLLLERGAFDGVHAALMNHPAAKQDVAEWPLAALKPLTVRYVGKAAHACGFPELGVNAADAMTVAQVAIGLLRQQMRPGEQVHGVLTQGGHSPGIIPDLTEAQYMLRAGSLAELEPLREKIAACFEAGAVATGATLEFLDRPEYETYAEMRHDPDLARAYRNNAEVLGRVFEAPGAGNGRPAASSDMGNISQVVPSIHPAIGINSWPAVNHQAEFAAHCVSDEADRAVIEGASALAWTAIDAATNGPLRERLLATS